MEGRWRWWKPNNAIKSLQNIILDISTNQNTIKTTTKYFSQLFGVAPLMRCN
jgi:hypothetical protein